MIARLLGPEGMGNYSYAVWVSALLLSAAHGGVPTAMTRYIAETLARRRWYALKRVFARLLVWQIAVVLVVCLTALLILRLTHPERPVLYLIAIAIVLPQVLHQAVTGAMTGLQRFDRIATVSVISATLNVGAVVIAASLRCGPAGVLLFVCLATSLSVIFGLLLLNSTFRGMSSDSQNWETKEFESYRSLELRVRWFSVTVWYLVLLDLVVWDRSEVFFLKRYSHISQVAIYSIAFTLVSKMWEAASSVTSNLAPLAADAIGKSDSEGVGRLYYRAVRYIHALLFPICIFGVGVCRPAVVLLYGRQYLSIVPVLQILLIVPVLLSLTEAGVAIVYAFERQGFLALAVTPTALLNIALAWLMVPRYGAIGAALASTAAQLVEAGVMIWLATRISRSAPRLSSVLRVWVLAVAAAVPAAVSSIKGESVLVPVILSLCGSVGFLWVLVELGEFNKVEFDSLKEAVYSMRRRLRTA